MPKIAILTSGQPSINPRMVKEADALADAGYDVIVIYIYWNEWATIMDVEMFSTKKWTAIRVAGNPTGEKLTYLFSRFIHKLSWIFASLFNFKFGTAENAIGRGIPWLLKAAIKQKADFYIAHNLAALSAAALAAKKNNCSYGFDAEDFHRNEASNAPSSFDVRLKTYLEDKYFKDLAYLTTASPMISSAYKKLYPQINPITILNVFPKEKDIEPIVNKKVNLFWFSQTIGNNRGLEDIITVLGKFNNNLFNLHLLGAHSEITKLHFINLAVESGLSGDSLKFYAPINEAQITRFASKFDIGLATELSYPKNRDICLANKIFTYVQAGLAIIASNTSAQKEFIKKYPGMGVIFDRDNLATLEEKLSFYLEHPNLLLEAKKMALKYADQELNWLMEKEKFLAVISSNMAKRTKSVIASH